MRARLARLLTSVGFKEEYFLVTLAILIGCATGIGAFLFYRLIEQATAWAYGHGGHGGLYHGRAFMLVLLPTVGALLVGFITYYFAREAKGHGVPEVMDAILRRGARIRPRVALAKAVSSAFTIGSGGAAGTEGPIIQIGAALGSSFGQTFHVQARQMSVLVACGAAAGIAAIFNAPIAGVLFALEIFLRDFSFRTFSPVVFASVLGCSTMHALKGGTDIAIFEVHRPEYYVFHLSNLPYYLVLGFLCAWAAVLFIKVLYKAEDIFDALKVPEQLKPAIGAVGLGISGIVYLQVVGGAGVPEFFGNGYPAIKAAISPNLLQFSIISLVVLLALKLLATSLTLGSGGSGGVFAPSLMIGAFLGGAFGLTLNRIGLVDEAGATAFALVGMAAVTAGTTHAPLTAIVILYELTREPKVILPVMFAAIVATAGAQLISKDSIYTLKLRRRGIRFGTLADLTILKRITADQVRAIPPQFVHPEDPLQKLLQIADETGSLDFVVTDDDGNYRGLVVDYDIKTALLQPEAVPLLVVGELVRSKIPTVSPADTLDTVLDKFARSDVDSLPLTAPHDTRRVEGLITRQGVMTRYQEELDQQTG
ncbi:MAG: chloride channel protein [Phycisphaerae bacterium]|nr:chloride channel protein [Phycisphaerae bacterium]